MLWMHDLLQEMGRQIVRRQSPKKPGKRSRLWKVEDVRHILEKNAGAEAVEGIILDNYPEESSCFEEDDAYWWYFPTSPSLTISAKTFSTMTNLRLLKIHNVGIPEGFDYFPQELRLIAWHEYPSTFLPSNLKIEKAVELSLPRSRITQLWSGTKALNKLRFMRLQYSRHLIRTPDFTEVPKLEELNLEGCASLRIIHPSLLVHKKLVLLNLKACRSLKSLPGKIAMPSLRKLVLSRCSNLKFFPEIVGSMECMSELLLDGTAIKELPLSIELLLGLVVLDLKDCQNLASLPSIVICLKSLKTLNLSGCSKLENVPEALGQVESLEELDLSGTAILQPPLSIFLMKNLKALCFHGCKGPSSSTSWLIWLQISLMGRSNTDSMALTLPSIPSLSYLKELDLSDCNIDEGEIPSAVWNFLSLEELNLSKNNFISLPRSINRLPKLRYLYLEDCKRLQFLPELPSNTRKVRVDGCDSLETSSGAFKFCKSSELSINCTNCFKLPSQKSYAVLMLKEIVEAELNRRTRIEIVAPGSEIPEWFSYQNEGSSIRIIKPRNSHDNLVGFAVCVVFGFPGAVECSGYRFRTHSLFLEVKASVGEYRCCSLVGFTDFDVVYGGYMRDHFWLLYFSCEEHFTLFDGHPNDVGHIEFSVLTHAAPRVKAKRFGVRPVYVHEVEEFNQKRIQWSLYGSTKDVATTPKRILTRLCLGRS